MAVDMTIPFEQYKNLINDSLLLEELFVSGVDNWEGYDDAISRYQERQVGMWCEDTEGDC